MVTYKARFLFPVAQPPLVRGTITVDGETIVAVEPHGVRTPDVDLGNVAIIPGLVNAHTHLDLSGARGLIPPTDPEHFCDWLLGVIKYRKTRTTEQMQGDIRDGLVECLNSGTTLIGDISNLGLSYDTLGNSPLRFVTYYELIGLSLERCWLVNRQYYEWVGNDLGSRSKGASPHAPYSASRGLCCGPAMGPKAIHFAESPAEIDLLQMRIGSFVTFLRRLGVYENANFIDTWQFCIDANDGDPEHNMLRHHHEGVVLKELARYCDKPVLFIHCNYLPTSTRFGRNHTIVFCPRTHAAFRHPRHPFPQFLARGVRVALGTDSLASNPDLDLLAEARFVQQHYPEVGSETVLKMATLNGAEALGWADVCGSLDVGKSADFVAVPLPELENGDPYELLLGNVAIDGPRRTMFRGEWR